MAVPLSVGRSPRLPNIPLGGMFAAPAPPPRMGTNTYGMGMRPRVPAPQPPPLPGWYPWERFHQNANPLQLARAMYRGVPSFAASLSPQMHAALFSPLHPQLPPSYLLMAAANPGQPPPTIFGGPRY
jgi:hypothetical protein